MPKKQGNQTKTKPKPEAQPKPQSPGSPGTGGPVVPVLSTRPRLTKGEPSITSANRKQP